MKVVYYTTQPSVKYPLFPRHGFVIKANKGYKAYFYREGQVEFPTIKYFKNKKEAQNWVLAKVWGDRSD
jgi:hypothetical protein